LNGITSVPNFMNIYQEVKKLVLVDTQTDRQTGDLISLLSFLEITITSTMIHLTYSFIYLTKQSVAQST
jgi:hypothetical protein